MHTETALLRAFWFAVCVNSRACLWALSKSSYFAPRTRVEMSSQTKRAGRAVAVRMRL